MTTKGPKKRMGCRCCEKDQEELSSRLSWCSRCHAVRYCSKECQEKDWKNYHKKECKHLKIMRATKTKMQEELKNKCGKSKSKQRAELGEVQASLNEVLASLAPLTLAVNFGANHIGENITGVDSPSHFLYIVHTSSIDVFKKSPYEELRNVMLLRLCPLAYFWIQRRTI